MGAERAEATTSTTLVVLRPTGAIDALSGAELVGAIDRSFPPAHGAGDHVQLRLDRVEFLDVAGLRSLLSCRNLVRNRGGDLTFVDSSVAVRRVVNLLPEVQLLFEEVAR